MDIPTDGCCDAGQAGSPMLETDFLPQEMASNCGRWFPTEANGSPRGKLLPTEKNGLHPLNWLMFLTL